jgi:hypothetical protein
VQSTTVRSKFFIRLLHSVHFREIVSGYFLFSRFDWSIFVTQLVAKHMKEIIAIIMIQLDRFEHVIKNADELIGSYKHEKIIYVTKSRVRSVAQGILSGKFTRNISLSKTLRQRTSKFNQVIFMHAVYSE